MLLGMHTSKAGMLLIGFLACLIGLIWIGQATSVFPYPAASPMIGQTTWAWRGLLMIALGVIAILRARYR